MKRGCSRYYLIICQYISRFNKTSFEKYRHSVGLSGQKQASTCPRTPKALRATGKPPVALSSFDIAKRCHEDKGVALHLSRRSVEIYQQNGLGGRYACFALRAKAWVKAPGMPTGCPGDMAELVDATDLKNNIWAFFEKSKKWKLSNSEKLIKKSETLSQFNLKKKFERCRDSTGAIKKNLASQTGLLGKPSRQNRQAKPQAQSTAIGLTSRSDCVRRKACRSGMPTGGSLKVGPRFLW